MKRFTVLVAVAMVVAACGGEAAAESDESSPTSVTTAEQPTNPGSTTDDQDTTTTTEPVDDAPAESATESTGTITMGGTTYYFIVEEGGTCDPDFFGTFRAFMNQVDSSGSPLVGQMVMSANAEGEGLFGGELEGVQWSAGNPDDGSTIDSVEIDGNRMTGTATFVRPDTGESQAGTFEVTCVGE